MQQHLPPVSQYSPVADSIVARSWAIARDRVNIFEVGRRLNIYHVRLINDNEAGRKRIYLANGAYSPSFQYPLSLSASVSLLHASLSLSLFLSFSLSLLADPLNEHKHKLVSSNRAAGRARSLRTVNWWVNLLRWSFFFTVTWFLAKEERVFYQ